MIFTNIDTIHEYDDATGDDITGDVSGNLLKALHDDINFNSRFTAEVERVPRKITNDAIRIRNIRLKDSKIYCGNHPAACELGGSHRKGRTLEGADWVEFNDLINNICDRLWIRANVSTAVCVIRKGYERRIKYGMFRDGNFWQWKKDEPDASYEDCCSRQAPYSEFPEGTPGIYSPTGYEVIG